MTISRSRFVPRGGYSLGLDYRPENRIESGRAT
jgi:hypothetical protein